MADGRFYYVSSYANLSYKLASSQGNDACLLTSTSANTQWGFYDVVIPVIMYHDESIANNQNFQGALDTALDFLNKVYSTNYGITFSRHTLLDKAITIDNNSSDPCLTGLNNPCENTAVGCSTDCRQHHKNSIRIANSIAENRDNGRIYVLWTNRGKNIFCDSMSGTHQTTDAAAWVWYDFTPSVIQFAMTSYYYTDTTAPDNANYSSMFMAGVLSHEVAHVFGMDDRYEQPGHSPSEDNEMECLMAKGNSKCQVYYAEVYSDPDIAFCPECKAILETAINTNCIG